MRCCWSRSVPRMRLHAALTGAPRIHAELSAKGIRVGRKRIARLMSQAGLVGASRRKFVMTTARDFVFGQRCRDAGVRPSMGSVGDAYDNAMCESFFATLEASYWSGAGSRRRPRHGPRSSISSRGSTIRVVAIRRSAISHRSITSAVMRASPARPSLPSCSRPSRTSPPGGPNAGPSLTAAARDGRTFPRAGTEEWLRRGPNKRIVSRRTTCRQIRYSNLKRSPLHETGASPNIQWRLPLHGVLLSPKLGHDFEISFLCRDELEQPVGGAHGKLASQLLGLLLLRRRVCTSNSTHHRVCSGC